MDQWTDNGSMDSKLLYRPMDRPIHADRQINNLKDGHIDGPIDQWIDGWRDRWTD